jgi:alpha/beta superfamily hydrolase
MTSLATEDGLTLEARWDLPETEPHSAIVLCHPHPRHGGTMDVPLIAAITGYLTEHGFAVLRFNFRGVGSSTGSWAGGVGEIADVATAVAAARETHPDLYLGVAGWSFGAVTSLRWQARARSGLPWVGIAPPVRLTVGGDLLELPDPDTLAPARRLFLIGDRDQFATPEAVCDYATRARARCEVIKGSDHFFYFRDRSLGGLAAAHLASRPW